jgi:hypothetical protein
MVAGPGVPQQPVRDAAVRLASDGAAVTLESAPPQTFVCAATEEFRQQVRARGGVLLVVTHAVNPTEPMRDHDLVAALGDHRTVVGWVSLAEVREAQPKQPAPSNPAVSGTTYVLHWSPRHLTVGPLLAHNPEPLAPEQAQAWAQKAIGRDTMIGWQPTIDNEPASGWFNIDFLSAAHYMLRQYPDGWRLVRSMSRVDGAGSGVETDNEARVWADKVVKFRDQVNGLRWAPGPTPDGATTLYAVAP